ncbi:hypothetical protein GYMLUDRAFT_46418 [Collybiopsis luxurians FD-317 M1]|uniref:BTB domain-containing protein n=1 Tax=Collybiopsis luxurians FD-317 M1 TaxID=944289 RepID=A0A0D0CPE1_9AGAR|nr:hypothetical protein GYMLUDRAFT_46418 [Collybiopsis luxurians FD-317 M1]
MPSRPIITRGDPWFEDGNIILIAREESSAPSEANSIGLRVHKGVLSRHSEVFQGMFELSQPDTTYDNDNDNELSRYEGCQVISMYDIPIELSNLVKALYDGAIFKNRSVDDFFYLAGILRLSTKYFITHLRAQAVKHLTQTWSHDLKGHDTMLELAIRTPPLLYESPDSSSPANKLSYPYVHPIHVLNLARSTNVQIVIPSAIYFLSLYPLADILRADHPKLQVSHPSKPDSSLQPPDLARYTLMFQRRLDGILDFINNVVGDRVSSSPGSSCPNGSQKTCTKNFQRLRTRLATSWVIRTGPFNFIAQTISSVSQDSDGFCAACRETFVKDAGTYRENFWAELPLVCGLPEWDVMKKEELS